MRDEYLILLKQLTKNMSIVKEVESTLNAKEEIELCKRLLEKEKSKNRKLTDILSSQQKEIVELKVKLLTAMKLRKEVTPEKPRSLTRTDKTLGRRVSPKVTSGFNSSNTIKGQNEAPVQSKGPSIIAFRASGTRNKGQVYKSLEQKSIGELSAEHTLNLIDTKEIETVLKEALIRVKAGDNNMFSESKYSTLPYYKNPITNTFKQPGILKKSINRTHKHLRNSSPGCTVSEKNKDEVKQKNTLNVNKINAPYKKLNPTVRQKGNRKME